jgi:2-keto-4-pentenoate hydratase/2-oxohepta-3-ene-1,7-dioic acid hydratase in catechol pathway
MDGGAPLPGLLDAGAVLPLDTLGYANVLAVIAGGSEALRAIAAKQDGLERLPLSEVRLLAPLLNPPRIFGIGLNYFDHAAEAKMKVQDVPTVFLKLPSSIAGPDDDIVLPKNSSEVDYEAELALVIGKGGYRIAAGEWKQHVFGYTILNDVSARDVQLATTQWTLGKSFPSFTPFGPSIVVDETLDAGELDIRLTIDGEVLQDANTRDLIFKLPQLIEYISSIVPLEAGDMISTGTPPGVGLGRTPKRWLKPGETVTIEIEKLGSLSNRTVAEG